jgi:hypothetical protein
MRVRKAPAARLSIYICCVMLSAMLWVAPASSGTLAGTVIGTAQNPKAFVRVEIVGPQSLTTFTNQEGTFSAKLAGGRYVVRILEANRRMEFPVEIPGDDRSTVTSTFKLPW